MIIFPIDKLVPLKANLFESHLKTQPNLEIHFETFTVDEEFEGNVISHPFDAPICAELFHLPSANVRDLQGQIFDFPLNPNEGFIDASIYFRGAHNPIDISRIEFGVLSQNHVPMRVTSRWIMTFEGAASNDFDFNFTVSVQT